MYIGPRGWVGLRLDVGQIDWNQVREVVADQFVAAKFLWS
jgi:hypothetical protein